MKKIKTSSLKPGMKFSDTVYIDEETVLLQAAIPLKQREIDLLSKWGIEEVLTEGDLISERPQAPAHKPAPASPAGPAPIYVKLVAQMAQVFDDLRAGSRVDRDRIDTVASTIIEEIDSNKDKLVRYVLLGGEQSSKLAAGAVNNAVLSTMIGRTLRLLSFKLVQLTTGALLHDVGMLRVDQSILSKEGSLTREELQQVRAHPVHGYTIVLRSLRYPEEIASIALLHQERWDGRGYPRRLKGEEIPLAARIVAVADAFEAMVNRRSYRDQVIGYRAIKAILSDNGRHFDPQVLKALLQSIGIHPVGSLVLLNDSSIGRVTENHSQAPLRPRIRLIVDSNGRKLAEERELDLLQHREIFIAKAIDPNEVESERAARG